MFRRILAALLFLPLLCNGLEPSFWVWQRKTPLSEAEIRTLRAQGVTTLYWHVGELNGNEGGWKWKSPPVHADAGGSIKIVPVVRIADAGKSPFAEKSVAVLLELLRPVAQGAGELQIDFDCPDRLLGDYAAALKKIRPLAPRLSITALAGWSHAAEWETLQQSVDEMLPMFYDVAPDAPLAQETPHALADAKTLEAQLAEWSRCKIPWRAGLPAFARITIFDAQGRSRGNIRAWGWDDVCFNKVLSSGTQKMDGIALLAVEKSGVVADTPAAAGETLAARWVTRASLADAVKKADAARAHGVVYFRLPDGTDPGGMSLLETGNLQSQGLPHLVLREQPPGRLALVNDSGVDLDPRLSGTNPHDRGYALELDADGPVFREANAGDFWRVTGHANPDTKPVGVAIPLATRLTFWFSHLRAGESLDCGPIQLAPNTAFKQIRYRILQLGDTWRTIE